jgi:hypothetical protein
MRAMSIDSRRVIAWALRAAAVGALAALFLGREHPTPTIALTGLPSGSENTSVHVQNVGNAPATIAMDLYTSGGLQIPGASEVRTNVPPGGTVRLSQAVNSGLVPGFRGVGVVSSDQRVTAVRVTEVIDWFRPTANMSYSIATAGGTGGHRLALPIVFNELLTAHWNSRITVANVGTQTACIRVTYYRIPGIGGATPPGPAPAPVVDNGPGGSGCSSGYPVPVAGQIIFGREPGYTRFPTSTDNNQMAAVVEVLNPSPNNRVTAIVDLYRSDGNRLFGSYNGLVDEGPSSTTDDVGTDVIVPIALKSNSGFYSVIGVMNLDGTPADVNIEYSGRLSDGLGAPQVRTVTLSNVTDVSFHSTYSSGPNVDLGFIGSARVTSSARIAVVVVRGKLVSPTNRVNEPIYTAVNGVPVDRGANAWSLPIIYRRFQPGPPPSFGYNSWIQVQVPDGGSANVTLRFVGDPTSGCPTGPYQSTHVVTGSKVFYMNLDNPDNGFGGVNPTCFFGGATVTADRPVIVIGQVGADKFPGGDAEGVYNAIPY